MKLWKLMAAAAALVALGCCAGLQPARAATDPQGNTLMTDVARDRDQVLLKAPWLQTTLTAWNYDSSTVVKTAGCKVLKLRVTHASLDSLGCHPFALFICIQLRGSNVQASDTASAFRQKGLRSPFDYSSGDFQVTTAGPDYAHKDTIGSEADPNVTTLISNGSALRSVTTGELCGSGGLLVVERLGQGSGATLQALPRNFEFVLVDPVTHQPWVSDYTSMRVRVWWGDVSNNALTTNMWGTFRFDLVGLYN